MQINLKTSGSIVLTSELREFVESKARKFEQLINSKDESLVDIELGTSVGGQKTGEVYRAEINLQYPGGFVRSEATRETMHKAIEVAVAEARAELRKKIGRKRDLVRRGAAKVKDFFRGFGGS
ncbi:MAG: ribosome-associated translation inhibitor RaiA [Patescibacteria group bacterium]